ncbi:GNAT family N-acetyltransferase [Acinetobacter proteolyticus]|jgi:GNAT superfamily N-acetyltransferase|uniref:GNAT family N-acetyltransferase n=1 Tax=Acinetobacter proteolyticus TaxID=1776741 RepID=A0A2N0WGR6_9GAMM|nr:GNAT family N-acetyltransferase [Acinetobacter proteolyticus]PKF34385.1 GNAT family N-acetyltransferase [Acinetobacter proteolyticus]WEI19443.1 GNAT family N-acetyltransferase [Acinetobacter proteolyticus]VXA54914.1 GNAT family N-acetyltransferase [Acinetobacter proteolyticus]
MLSYRLLCSDSETDIASIQAVFEATPNYFKLIQGYSADKNAARNDLKAVPSGHPFTAKFFYAIYHKEQMIGCMDILQGYPESSIVFIGLLLFIESHQGLGYGTQAVHFISGLAHVWGCDRLRIAVVQSNEPAFSFWSKEGFVELYRKELSEYVAPVIVMERKLIFKSEETHEA